MLRLRAKKAVTDIQITSETPCSPEADLASEGSCSSFSKEALGCTGSEDSCKESSFLLIHVHEARNLVAKDYETNSSDPFVKVTLGSCSKKTRVIYRNCHPSWEQQLLFPLDGVSEAEPLTVEVWELNNLTKSKQFLGQVVMTVAKALDIAQHAAMGQNYWFGLGKRHSTDIVGGELCLGFRTLDAVSYVNLLSELEHQMDTDAITNSLASKALHIQLQGLNGLRASGLIKDVASQVKPRGTAANGMSLFIKFGHMTMEKPLPELTLEPQVIAGEADLFELAVNEEVVMPLAAAVRPERPRKALRKDELFDVKLYIKRGSTTIAKTQIPIWDIPEADTSSSCVESPTTRATADADSATIPAVYSTPGSPQLSKESPSKLTAGKLLLARAGSLSLNGLKLDTIAGTGGCGSAPTTPRMRLSNHSTDHPSAAGVLASPRSSRASSLAGDETLGEMRSSKSEAQLTRLGAGCNSAGSGAKDFVEGSLSSVTCTRGAQPHHKHATALLARRKVQGLSELDNNFKAALKAAFVPPREVSRMGWTSTRKSQYDEAGLPGAACNQGLKYYRRLMESYVPMHAHMELGVALVLLSQATEEAQAPSLETTDDAGCIQSDDSDDVSDATPITLPAPFDNVLQDVVVNVGVNSLYALLLGHNSEFMAAHHASEELMDMVMGPWQPGTTECLRTRQVSYTKKLNIPVPLAPKQCHVWEEHQVLVKEDGGFVAQHICTNDAPKGDCFKAVIQICGVFVSSGSSRLRISMKLDWHKNTFGKGMVQTGAEADSKRGWGRLVASLQKHAGSKLRLAGGSTAAAVLQDKSLATVSCAGSTCSSTVDASGTAAKVIGSKRLVSSQSSIAPMIIAGLLLAVVLLLLILVAAVWSGAKSVSVELHELNAVLRTVANMQCGGAAALGGTLNAGV